MARQTVWHCAAALLLAATLAWPVQGHRHLEDGSTEDPQEFDGHYDINVTRHHGRANGGGWSQWSEWSMCSRTCDGGVSRQLRTCSAPEGCRGEPVRYKICNMQPCAAGANLSRLLEEDSWRRAQCAAHDATPYGGELLRWKPHRDDAEPCALTCRGYPQPTTAGTGQPTDQDGVLSPAEEEEERVVVAVLASRVLDGTRCRPGSLDMCIDGRCQRVGCDLRVGSSRRVDECGVCGGDGASCSRPRHRWLDTSASLCSATCGGGYKMSLAVCRDRVAGTDVAEELCDASSKPAPSVVRCNTHPCPFKWYVGEWTPCSASCGGGVRTRRVLCARSANLTRGETYQPGSSAEPPCAPPPPHSTAACSQHECPQWRPTQWSGCSVSCGSGVQVRGAECASADGGGGCEPDARPETTRPCSTGIACPEYRERTDSEDDIEDLIPGVVYHTQPLIQPYPPAQARAEKLIGEPEVPVEATFIKDEDWGPCSVSCGEGWRKKEVHCKIFLEFSRTIAKLPDSKCTGPKPNEETERCVMEPCSMAYGTSFGDSSAPVYNGDSRSLTYGSSSNIRVAPGSPGKSYSWKEKGYTSCSASCLSGVQELIIQCVRDEDGKNASPYMCDPHTKPENRVRTCNDHPCPPRWNYTDFSPCTKSCGIGIQTREVNCIHEVTRGGTNTVVVPNNMCPQPPPSDRQYCNVLDCPVRWHTGDWSKCSKTCGGGAKDRKVECKQIMAQSHVVERPASLCAAPRPQATRPCNARACLLDTATPEIGLANSSYIQHDPKKKKVTVKIGGSATIFYGTQVKIKCPVKGYNRTKIQWAKNQQLLTKSKKFKISKKGALRITSLTYQESGIYTCVAGRSNANLTLLVKPRPGEFPSSEEIERHKALDDPSSPLADSRSDGRYRAIISGDSNSEDHSHEQRPGDPQRKYNKSKTKQTGKTEKSREVQYGAPATTTTKTPSDYNSQARDPNYDENEESASSHFSPPGMKSDASRMLPCLHSLFVRFQTLASSRGQRMVDSLVDLTIFEQHFGLVSSTEVMNLEEKQLIFPEDNDDDIVIVKDKSKKTISRDNETYVMNIEGTGSTFNVRTEVSNDSNTWVIAALVSDGEDYAWLTTAWSPCSASCGAGGKQIRGAQCLLQLPNLSRTVETEECARRGLTAPQLVRDCTAAAACPVWRTRKWTRGACVADATLGQRRVVECRTAAGKPLARERCDAGSRPQDTRRLRHRACRATWAVGEWSECTGACGGSEGAQFRALRCVWRAVERGPRSARHGGRERGAGRACAALPRPRVTRDCRTPECQNSGGECKDTSKFCENVRAMNMCVLRSYKLQCCKSCAN